MKMTNNASFAATYGPFNLQCIHWWTRQQTNQYFGPDHNATLQGVYITIRSDAAANGHELNGD